MKPGNDFGRAGLLLSPRCLTAEAAQLAAERTGLPDRGFDRE